MARNGQLSTRRKFVSTGKKSAIANACQNALENLEDRRLLSAVVGTGGLESAHGRHMAHVHHLNHLKQLGLEGAAPVAAPAAALPAPAPLPAGTPNSIIQPATDAFSNSYLAFPAVDGIITNPDNNATWNVVSGPAADGFNGPQAGFGTPVLQAGGAQPDSGIVTFNIHFSTPGQYKLYVRDKFSQANGLGGDNSMFVPPSGGPTSASPTAQYDNDSTGADNRTDNNWTWDITQPNIVYNVTAAGDTTISFNMREAGYYIDRIVLSQNQNLQGFDLDGLPNSPVAVGAPASLTGTVDVQNVNLTWTPVIGATSYDILRGSTSGNYTTIQSGVSGTTTTDFVPNLGHWFYVVRANGSNGPGTATSPEADINVTGQLLPPNTITTTGSTTKVTISWNPPSNGVPTGYDVKRGTSANGPFTVIGANVQNTTFDDTTAAVNTIYYYVVDTLTSGAPASVDSAPVAGNRAFVGSGEGWSAQYFADNTTASGTPQFQKIDPIINLGINPGYGQPNGPGQIAGSGVPASFNAVPHPNHPGDVDPGQNFSIRWEGKVQAQYTEAYTLYPDTDDGVAIYVDGVLLEDKLTVGRAPFEDTVPVSATPALAGGITTGAPVVWTAGSVHDIVMLYQEGGGGWGYYLKWSSPSTPKDFIPTSQVQAVLPVAPTVTAVPNNASVVLNWNNLAADSYTVLRSSGGGAYAPVASNLTATTYTDTSVTNGTTYSYEVVGVVQLGAGTPSAPVSATPNPLPPTQPTGVGVEPRQTGATVRWTAVNFATGYNILRGPVGGPYAALPAGQGVTGTSFTDNTAVLGQTYAYEVIATNSSGPSPASVPVTADLLHGSIVHYYNNGWWNSATQTTAGYTTASINASGSVIYPGFHAADSAILGVPAEWTNGSPDPFTPGTNVDNFSTITTAQITIDAATAVDPILFALETDDAGYLYVDGTLVASDPKPHGPGVAYLNADNSLNPAVPGTGAGTSAGTPRPIILSAGQHNIMLFQSENGGGAAAFIRWQPHFTTGTTPNTVLVPDNLITAISGAPAKPTIVSATASPGTGAIIQYFDNATNEISYIFQRSTTPTFDLGTVTTLGGSQGLHDNINDNNISFTDTSNQLTQKLYYRVLAVNFEGSTPSDVLSVDAAAVNQPGAEAHFFNNEWWKSADQSTFAPATKGASVAPDATTLFTNGINNTAGAAATGPFAGIPGTNFSSVFTGKIHINAAGPYTFNTQTDDDSYLYVDGVLVSADPGGHGIRNAPIKNPITLTAGDHDFQFFQSQGGGGWGYLLQYNGADTGNVDTPIPPSAFTSSLSTPLVAPGALSFTNVSAGAITVNWGDTNNDEIRYVIERSTDNFVSNDVVVTRGINATSFTDFTVAPNTPYSYRVHAENFDYVGPSVSGNTASITPVGTGGSVVSSNPGTPNNKVDLTALGTIDWAHWGVNTANTFDHRGAATEHISDVTTLNGGVKTQYTTSPTAFSWNNGGPYNTGVTNTTTGIYTAGINTGFEFTAPADTTTRVLYVYVGVVNATGKLTAHLTDGSAVQFTNATLDATGATPKAGVYTITYKAASAGQALVVDWTESVDHGSGIVALGAAALGSTSDFATPTFVSVQQGAYTGRVDFVNNTPTATSILVQRSTDPNFGAGTVTSFTTAGNATGFSDVGPFTIGTRYYYRVQAQGPGGVTSPISGVGSFLYRPVPTTIDHSTGFAPPTVDLGQPDLVVDGSFETPFEPGANFYYDPTGGTWTFTGTTGVIFPPSGFGTPNTAVAGSQYLFVQTNTGDNRSDAVNGQTVSETIPNFVAGQQYVFSVYEAARNGNAPTYTVTLDPGTPNAQIIYIGTPNSNQFTQKFSAPFTASAGSHVLQIAAAGTTDNTAFLDQASILPYVSGGGNSDLTLNYNTPVGATGGSNSPVLPLITPDGKLELTENQNNDDRSAYETTSVPLSGDFTTTFDFQNSGNLGADGFAFVLQSAGRNQIGGGGGGLGIQGVPNSVAVQFNMYQNVTQTGLVLNGAAPGASAVNMSSLGNAFHPTASPTDIFHVTLNYNYATKTLTETVVDTGSTVPGGTGTVSFTQNYTVDIPAVLGNLGQNQFAYVGFAGATGGANSYQDVLNWKFQTAPTALNNNFLYQSGPRKVSMQFNEDVSASLQASDLVAHNIDTNTDVSPTSVSYDAATNTATWTFGTLPNGNYHASVALGSVNDSSNLHVGATGLDFFWLNGDTNRDRTVSFADLVAVAQHYGQNSGAVLATGDLDGDGKVSFADLVAVAQNYGKTLALPAGAAPVAAGAVSSPSDEAAVLAALPSGPAKTFAINFLGLNTPAKPAPVTKPAPVSTPVVSKPATVTPVVKPTATGFSTTRITPSVVKKDTSLLS